MLAAPERNIKARHVKGNLPGLVGVVSVLYLFRNKTHWTYGVFSDDQGWRLEQDLKNNI